MHEDLMRLPRAHLARVQAARREPTDWTDLSVYGFYCLEAAVVAAAEHLGWRVRPTHQDKQANAARLASEVGLPDITTLLSDLNQARKAAAYGDIPAPALDADAIAPSVEGYVEAVSRLIEGER